MNRIFFDLGALAFWSSDSLDNKRLISKGDVIISDEAALDSITLRDAAIDPDVQKMLFSLMEAGYSLNVCDEAAVNTIKAALRRYGLLEMIDKIVSASRTDTAAKNLRKLRNNDDFFIFVGDSENCIETMSACQIPCIAYGENRRAVFRDCFGSAMDTLEVEDQVYTTRVIHDLARAAIEKKVRILGIDGIDFAGKKVFAERLGRYMTMLGQEYLIVNLEDFHRSVEQSYRGEDPVEAYYFNGFNLDKLIDEVLDPFVKNGSIDKVVYCLDNTYDAFVNEREYQLSEGGIMILLGPMMYREPLLRYFDMTVYMHVDYKESEHRASLLDAPLYGEDPVEVYRKKNIPAQKMYVERHDPFEHRDFVIDNSNYHRPFFMT